MTIANASDVDVHDNEIVAPNEAATGPAIVFVYTTGSSAVGNRVQVCNGQNVAVVTADGGAVDASGNVRTDAPDASACSAP